MANRLTDKQKKKIVADYLELGSYRATARKNNVSADTVKRTVTECDEIEQKLSQKKAENTADILAYMESQRGLVCEIIGKGLAVLNDEEKLREATPAQITTALGTLIDKWAAVSGSAASESREDDPITKSLKEMAEELESDE